MEMKNKRRKELCEENSFMVAQFSNYLSLAKKFLD